MGDEADAANGMQQEVENDDMPKFNLYIRASLIDNETQGACPISQLGFMLSYLLAQEKNVDFKVWTVSQVNPPIDFKEKNRAKIYPFIEGISGLDNAGSSIAGLMTDSADAVENFFDSVNHDCEILKRPKVLKNHILGKVNGISSSFNSFLKGLKKESHLTSILQKVDEHLAETGTTFLEGDTLSYTDCFLLPKLQHIIVAGKFYKAYEIPHTMKNLWRYIRDAYETPAFRETLPFDEDLCKSYWEKTDESTKTEVRRRGHKGVFGVDQVLHKTCEIPADVAAALDGGAGSNGQEEETVEEVEPVQPEELQVEIEQAE